MLSLNEDQKRLANDYVGYARAEWRKFNLRYKISPGDRDDYLSFAYYGLIRAALNFDPTLGFDFMTFCTPRVRGAMLDELRTRCGYRKVPFEPEIDTDQQFRDQLGLAVLRTVKDDEPRVELVYANQDSPDDLLYREKIRKMVLKLKERRRKLIVHGFYDDRPFAELMEIFGVSEGRICQMRAQAFEELRKKLRVQKIANSR